MAFERKVDLLRAPRTSWRAVQSSIHDLAHLVEPPARPTEAPMAPGHGAVSDGGIEAEFHLRFHNNAVFCENLRAGGETKAVTWQ